MTTRATPRSESGQLGLQVTRSDPLFIRGDLVGTDFHGNVFLFHLFRKSRHQMMATKCASTLLTLSFGNCLFNITMFLSVQLQI